MSADAPWEFFNPLTRTYDTRDGTKVAEELVLNVRCLADVLHIAGIRAKQRAAIAAATGATTQEPNHE